MGQTHDRVLNLADAIGIRSGNSLELTWYSAFVMLGSCLVDQQVCWILFCIARRTTLNAGTNTIGICSKFVELLLSPLIKGVIMALGTPNLRSQ